MLLSLLRLIPTASRTQAAIDQTGAAVTSLAVTTPEAAAAEGVIGNIGITQASGTSVATTEASAQTMLTKLESIRAVLADGDGVNIAIQNMDIDMDNLETILNGATLAEGGSPVYVTNTLINNIKTAVEKLDNAIISLGQAVGTAEATLVAGTDGANLRGLLTDNTGKLQVDIDALPTAQIGATGAANSMSVTLATDDHLLSTIDQTNDRINVNVDDATSTDGGSVPANGVMIGGTDGTNFQHLKVNTDGELFVNLEAANFNVGDVDIASATFEKEEDAAHTSADKGVHVLAVRKDTAVAQTSADGDYSSLLTDADGKLHVNAGPLAAQVGTVNIGDVSLAPSVADGATLTSVDGLSVGGKDASGNFQMLDVETNGKLNVVSETASEFKVTEASASAIKDAVEKLDNTVNGSNQLDVNIAAGGFSGAVTGTFWQSTQPVSGTVTANAGSGTQAVSIASMPSTPVTGSFYPTTQNTSQVQSALYTKQYTVTTTAAQAWGTSSQATASGLTVLADTTNTGIVYVGGSTVTAGTAQATDGIPLAAGAAFTFSIDDANKIYAITASGVTGQKLNLVAM